MIESYICDEYIIRGIYYQIYIIEYRLLGQIYPNRNRPNTTSQTWSGLVWAGWVSTPGGCQKLRIWKIKDIRPTKRLASLWVNV